MLRRPGNRHGPPRLHPLRHLALQRRGKGDTIPPAGNAMLQFSDEAARKLEAIYSSVDIIAQRRATLERLALNPGESVIDIGCGPGFLCEEMANAVGRTGRVLGIDISDDLLSVARERNEVDWLTYEQGDARELDVPDATFEVAVSAQTLEFIDNADRALAEMFRVLKPGGRALIMNTDWDRVAWYSSDLTRMGKVRKAWEAHCEHPRLPQTLVPRLRSVGFAITQLGTFPIINTRLEGGTYSHGLVDLMLDFLGARGTVAPEELAAWAAELRTLSAEGRYLFSTTRCFFGVRKPATDDTPA
jgi:arsenite methyltransferase